jgi:phosphatidylglycerophosphatase C
MMYTEPTMSNRKTLHLCDFDGTITHEDSLPRFLKFAVPVPGLIGGGFILIFRFLALILSGNWSKGAGKAALLSVFFKGRTTREMEELGNEFYRQKIPAMFRTALLAQLRTAHQNGDTVVVVSASLDVWLRPFCAKEGFGLLCTELEYLDGRFTGQFATPNCKGAEKATRIQSAYKLSTFHKILAYGNSKGDAEMYALATKVFKF